MITRRSLLSTAPAILKSQTGRPPNILFCISDDQSWIHAGAYGSRFVRTPAFDRVAREGVLFRNAFVSTPSCAPSRASVLTGQDFYRLGPASMNHTEWQRGTTTYVDALAARGYQTGFTGKGWAPGNWQVSGRGVSPCGPAFNKVTLRPPDPGISATDYAGNFAQFLQAKPADTPFCFWTGFVEPHRIFGRGAGRRGGGRPEQVAVPGFLPDTAEVRDDLLDYAHEIQWYDRQLDRMLDLLKQRGELDRTLVVVTADNGMAFPRAKGNLYEYGVHMPLAVRWGERVKGGRTVDDFVSFPDFAPTFLEACGLSRQASMTGRSLMPLLASANSGQIDPARDHAVFGIERHFPGSRPKGAGYPSRGIRTKDHLYIRNLTPDRNPVGDHPGPVWPEDDPVGGYGDSDGGPSKTELWKSRDQRAAMFAQAFGKRPAEELYDVRSDPFNQRNLAPSPLLGGLRTKLDAHLKRTGDPRITGNGAWLDAVMTKYPALSPEVNRAETKR
ncbi:MAG: sulfatase [Bryobacteraceae bacterium]|nr:sulfatase [Bryobacteraceae bacterium]